MPLQHRTLRRAAIVGATLALFACGDGGKGGAGQGSGLTINPTSLAFSADQNGSTPPAQSIQATVTDPNAAFIGAGYPAGTQPPSWLVLSLSGSGANWSVQVAIASTGLAPGTYSATVRVAIERSDRSVIAYRDAQVTYTLSSALHASPSPLTFTFVEGGAAPSTQTVSLSGTSGLAWTATADQGWVVLGAAGGTTPSSVSVGVDPTGLVAGSYSATVTFSAAGKIATVGVSLTVAAPALQASAARLSFGGVNGAPIAAQTLAVSMNNASAVGWSATAGHPWLVLGKTSGTTPDTLSVSVDPAVGPLASGTYASTVAFTAGGGSLTATVDVDLTLTKAAFSLTPGALVLGGADGRDLASRSVQLGLNTGTSSYTWSATPSATWMAASPATGAASATPATVDVTPDPTGLTGGTYTGTLAFSAAVNGDSISGFLPVTFNLESHKLLVTDDGVALASMPALSKLTHTVRVTDNLGAATPWSATSDQTWLGVTSSGTAGGDLVLTADPAGLTTDALYLATVSISSSDPTVENVETVRVGLWVGSATPGIVTIGGSFSEIVADPVRPYAYAHSGGTDITAYHVYTGAAVATFAAIAPSLGAMAVASDGSRLFAVDRTNSRVVPVNLADRTLDAPWSLVVTGNTYPRLGYMRTDGLPVLPVTDGAVHSAVDGSALLTFATSYQVSSSTLVTTSLEGKAFCAVGCRSLSYSSLGGGTLSSAPLSGGSALYDIALNADGSRVYGASGYPYSCSSVDTATGTTTQLGSNLYYPGNVEVGPDGRVYCGRYSMGDTNNDVWVFDGTGVAAGSFRLAATSADLLYRQLAISGDGLRAAGLTSSLVGTPALRIVTVP